MHHASPILSRSSCLTDGPGCTTDVILGWELVLSTLFGDMRDFKESGPAIVVIYFLKCNRSWPLGNRNGPGFYGMHFPSHREGFVWMELMLKKEVLEF